MIPLPPPNTKPYSVDKVKKIAMLWGIGKEDTSQSFRSLCFPKLLIFVDMFYANFTEPMQYRAAGCG